MDRHHNITVKPVSDGAGLGLFATRPLKAGDIVFEEEAYFKMQQYHSLAEPTELVLLYRNVQNAFGALLDQSCNREELESILFRLPPETLLLESAETLYALNEYDDAFSQLNKDSKLDHLNGFINFQDGSRAMQDSKHEYLGFSVFGSLLNHSCIPNALYCISEGQDRTLQKLDFTSSGIQVRALVDIQAGDEITVSYCKKIGDSPQSRREYLKTMFGFDCKCKSCKVVKPELDHRVCTLLTAYQDVLNLSHLYAPSYRSGWTVLSIAKELHWNDVFLLRTLEFLGYKAEQSQDRLRAKYFTLKCLQWCAMFLPEGHDRSLHVRRIYQSHESLGVPSVPMTPKDLRLIYMLNHSEDDSTYYFVRFGTGNLVELPEDQNKLLCNWAARVHDANATEVGWEEHTLSGMIYLFGFFEAEVARTLLLKELAALEQSATSSKPTRKQKTKTQRKQAAKATKQSDSITKNTTLSLPESSLPGPSLSKSPFALSNIANSDTVSSPRDTNGLQPAIPSPDLDPTGWEKVENKKKSQQEKIREYQKKKTKAAALKSLKEATHAQQGRASQHLAATRVVSQAMPLSAPAPSILVTPPHSASKITTLRGQVSSPSFVVHEVVKNYPLTPEHSELRRENEFELDSITSMPPKSQARSETEPGSPKSPYIDILTDPESASSRPSPLLNLNTPSLAVPIRPVPIESQTVQPALPDLPFLIPQINLPITDTRPLLLSHQFVHFSNETRSWRRQAKLDRRDDFDTPEWYPQQTVFNAVVDDADSFRPHEMPELRGRRFSFELEPTVLQDSVRKQFRRVKKSDPCDESSTLRLSRHHEDDTTMSTNVLSDFVVSFTGNTYVNSHRLKEIQAPDGTAHVEVKPEPYPWISAHDKEGVVDSIKRQFLNGSRIKTPGDDVEQPPLAEHLGLSEQSTHTFGPPVKQSHVYDLRA